MLFFFNKGFGMQSGPPTHSRPPYRGGGTGLLLNGILCLVFGIAIFSEPDLVAYFIAGFLVFVGISILMMWWRMRG